MILSPHAANITFQQNDFATIIFSLVVIGGILLLAGYFIRRRE